MLSAKAKKKASERMKKYWAENRQEIRKAMKAHWNIKKGVKNAQELGAGLPIEKLECASNEKVVHCPYCRGKFGLYSDE